MEKFLVNVNLEENECDVRIKLRWVLKGWVVHTERGWNWLTVLSNGGLSC
jgi:hypothetical protein